MAGIVFLRTAAFDAVREFYLTEVGMEIWLEQPGVPTARTASTPPAVLTSELDKENGNRLIARRTAQRFSLAAPQRGHSPQLPTDMRPRDDVALPRAARHSGHENGAACQPFSLAAHRPCGPKVASPRAARHSGHENGAACQPFSLAAHRPCGPKVASPRAARHGNMLVGFHRQPQADLDALLTFFYETREEVDRMYARLHDVATDEPKENPKHHDRRTATVSTPGEPHSGSP